MATTTKPRVRSQRVVVEYNGGDWMVMFNDGHVEVFGDAQAAATAIQRAAARRNDGITVTRIQWRNAPEGFVPPTKT